MSLVTSVRAWAHIDLEHLFKKAHLARGLTLVVLGLCALSSSRWAETHPYFAELLFVGGVLVVTVAVGGRLWAVLYQAGHKNRTLLTTGPYSVCRNPMYAANLLGAVGLGLATQTLVLPVVFLAALALLYPSVIRREEANLAAHHGAAFQAYRERVPAIWPRWSLLQESDVHPVRAGLFRAKLLNSLWFIPVLALIHAITFLHAQGTLPTLLHLY